MLQGIQVPAAATVVGADDRRQKLRLRSFLAKLGRPSGALQYWVEGSGEITACASVEIICVWLQHIDAQGHGNRNGRELAVGE